MDLLLLVVVAVVAGALGALIGFHLEHSKNAAERAAYAKLSDALAKADNVATHAEAIAASTAANFEAKFAAFAQSFPAVISDEVKAARDAAAEATNKLQLELAAHAQTQAAKASLETQVATIKAAVS